MYIYDLKKQIPGLYYTPIKYDDTDKILSQYLNSSTKKIDQMTPALMFHRISEGFYEFGTKKIQL